MKQIVKLMVDGQSNEVSVEADTHAEAVEQLFTSFTEKNQNGKMLSEKLVIYSEMGIPLHKITNIYCLPEE